MARKLVVCCDGTWNTPRTETNIFRTYRFLRERLGTPAEVSRGDGVRTCGGRAVDGSEVVLFYDAGVGTDWFARLLGGGVGAGLSDNVRDAYHFLGHNYTPGTDIYLFGFSRGAYTARSLCGFIKAAGLLDKPSVKDVWRIYMDRYVMIDRASARVVARPSGWDLDRIRDWLVSTAGDAVGRLGHDVDRLPSHGNVTIKFIGVYDTVGALGVPIPAAAMNGVTPDAFGRSTSAPCWSRRRTTSLSNVCAARSSGVAPVVRRSSRKRLSRPPRLGSLDASCGFGFTPAASSARMTSRDSGGLGPGWPSSPPRMFTAT